MTSSSLIAADSAMGLVVAGMISITGFEIMNESIKQLTDTNNEELVSRMHTLIEKEEIGNPKMIGDVIDINQVHARQVGSAALVDVKITTAEGLSTSATRAIEDQIKWRILEEEGRGSGESVGIVLDAEVHATTHGTKSCPLLFASIVMNHDGDSNGKSIYSNGKNSSNGTSITWWKKMHGQFLNAIQESNQLKK